MKKFYCNNCKCEVSEKDTYCPNCGSVFDDEEDEVKDEEYEAKQEKSKKYYCNNCQNEVTEEDTYCPYCGSVFNDEEDEEYEKQDEELRLTDNHIPLYEEFKESMYDSEYVTDRKNIKLTKEVQKEYPNIKYTNYQKDIRNNDVIYDIKGVRGRYLEVYEDKVILTTKLTIGSFITRNVTDGEKTIYYVDCNGIQYRKYGISIGYLQLETSSNMMNNRKSNFFNENTFTFDINVITNKKMEEIANYIKGQIDKIKSSKNSSTSQNQTSIADEIKKYKELLDIGAITEEEYNKVKKELLK